MARDHFVARRLLSLIHKVDDGKLFLHPLVPSHNQLDPHFLAKISQDMDELDEFEHTYEDSMSSNAFLSSFPVYEKLKYKTGLSFVLHCGSGVADVAGDLVKSKIHWAKKLHLMRPKNVKEAFKEIEQLIKSVNKGVGDDLKASNQEFLDLFLNEPEPSFKGSYNWLYSGGCLSSFQDENNIYLCSADFLVNDPVIKFFELSEDCTKILNKQEFELTSNRPGLQVALRKHQEDLIIGVRQNSTFTILSALAGRGNVLRKWKKSLQADRIFTSFDFSSSSDNVVLTDVDAKSRTIKIYSLETTKPFYSHSNKVWKYKDSWNKVMYRNEEVLLADRTHFYIIDPRASGKFSLEFSPLTLNEWNCEKMCNMLVSKFDSNVVYLGLPHSLIQLDIRFPKTVQKWNHLMKHNPQFGDVTEGSNCEIIILQGSDTEDFVGVTNDYVYESEDRILLSKTTPCLLKGLKNSLRVAHYNEIGLNPLVSERFDCTLTGTCVVKDRNGDIHYFITNSFGDIYGCKIKDRDDDTNVDINHSLDSIKNYEEHISDLCIGKNFRPHKVEDYTHIFKKVEELGLNKDQPKTYWYPTQWKYREMYTPESLKSFKDYISQKILAVWGIQCEGMDFEEEEELKDDDDEIPFADKVEGWLSRME